MGQVIVESKTIGMVLLNVRNRLIWFPFPTQRDIDMFHMHEVITYGYHMTTNLQLTFLDCLCGPWFDYVVHKHDNAAKTNRVVCNLVVRTKKPNNIYAWDHHDFYSLILQKNNWTRSNWTSRTNLPWEHPHLCYPKTIMENTTNPLIVIKPFSRTPKY